MSQLQRRRMSYDEWWALPEHPRTEFVDGEVIVMGDPHPEHSAAQLNLAMAFKSSLTDVFVYPTVAVRLPRNRYRVPDISVFGEKASMNPVTLTPVLVVEVLSPSTRSEDLLRKSIEYARAGISQYWIVDTEKRVIDVLRLVDEDDGANWVSLARLTDEEPTGSVVVGEHGTVDLDLAAILDG